MDGIRPLLKKYAEVLVLMAILLAIQLFPEKLPGGLYGKGVVQGSALALNAIGLILIYRSNRIINFAQVQVGLLAATLFTVLVQYRSLLRGLTNVCAVCRITPTLEKANYWVSLFLALAFGVLLGYAIYAFIIKRFSNAPRLIVTVATIFVAQLLGGLQGLIPQLLTTEDERIGGVRLDPARLPFDWHFSWSPARFDGSEALMVLAAAMALVGVMAYLRLSDSGLALRASSQDAARAETLGVDVAAVTGRAWVIAGALSAVVGIVGAMSFPPVGQASLDVGGTVRILAVAVIARMVRIPVAALAALVMGVLFQAVPWSFETDVILDGVLLGFIIVVLLIQSRQSDDADLERASSWRAAREIRPIPQALRSLTVVRRWVWTGGGLAAVTLLAYPWVMSLGQTITGTSILLSAVLGLSLLVLTGWGGQISLGQFAIAAVGGYVAAVTRLPFVLALPAGAVAAAVIAGLLGIPALRLRGLYLAVTTLAFALAVPVLLLSPTYLGKALPDKLERPSYFGLDLQDHRVFYYVTLFVLTAAVFAVAGLRNSRTARALIAGRDNEAAAQSFGIDLFVARVAAFAISGFLAGLAGALIAFQQYGAPESVFPAGQSITIFIMAVIGGLGSVAGPLIGALYLGVLDLASATPVVRFIATGGGGLLLLFFLPGGLSQMVFGLRDSLLRRMAERRGVVVPSLMGVVPTQGRVPISAKARPGGGTVIVPPRYRLEDQWALAESQDGRQGKLTRG